MNRFTTLALVLCLALHQGCCESQDVMSGLQELSALHCGEPGHEDFTADGNEISLMSRSWMAVIQFRSYQNQQRSCAGTLISKRFVMTVAHCSRSAKWKLTSVLLGEHSKSHETDCMQRHSKYICAPPVESIEVETLFSHKEYSDTEYYNDIALVKLSRDVQFKRHIHPICLPVTKILQDKQNELNEYRVTGWGKTENSATSDVPREAIVPGISRSDCQNNYTSYKIESTQLCAGDFGRDSCNGDSGAPLILLTSFSGKQRFVQYGIVSFGSENCGDGTPGVYTNVASYMNWIARIIGAN